MYFTDMDRQNNGDKYQEIIVLTVLSPSAFESVSKSLVSSPFCAPSSFPSCSCHHTMHSLYYTG